jgi:tripartite-type tricarboxylate transporter receptor subunit TctC
VFASAGTPPHVVLRINAEMQRVFELPDVADNRQPPLSRSAAGAIR